MDHFAELIVAGQDWPLGVAYSGCRISFRSFWRCLHHTLPSEFRNDAFGKILAHLKAHRMENDDYVGKKDFASVMLHLGEALVATNSLIQFIATNQSTLRNWMKPASKQSKKRKMQPVRRSTRLQKRRRIEC